MFRKRMSAVVNSTTQFKVSDTLAPGGKKRLPSTEDEIVYSNSENAGIIWKGNRPLLPPLKDEKMKMRPCDDASTNCGVRAVLDLAIRGKPSTITLPMSIVSNKSKRSSCGTP